MINQSFVTKMIRAKKLEIEAFRDLMPECMQKQVNNIEMEIMRFAKEVVVEVMQDNESDNKKDTKKTKKVEVEFD